MYLVDDLEDVLREIDERILALHEFQRVLVYKTDRGFLHNFAYSLWNLDGLLDMHNHHHKLLMHIRQLITLINLFLRLYLKDKFHKLLSSRLNALNIRGQLSIVLLVFFMSEDSGRQLNALFCHHSAHTLTNEVYTFNL